MIEQHGRSQLVIVPLMDGCPHDYAALVSSSTLLSDCVIVTNIPYNRHLAQVCPPIAPLPHSP